MVAVLLSTCPEAGDALWQGVRQLSGSLEKLLNHLPDVELHDMDHSIGAWVKTYSYDILGE